jgi:hypothetical protein
VLSSAPLQLIGSRPVVTFGNESYKLNLKSQNYKHNNYTRNLVGRSFGRCLHNRLLSGSAEASTVLRAVVADFFFNCQCMEIPSDNHIRHTPRCVHCHAQSFLLETFKDFYVGSGSRTPELH